MGLEEEYTFNPIVLHLIFSHLWNFSPFPTPGTRDKFHITLPEKHKNQYKDYDNLVWDRPKTVLTSISHEGKKKKIEIYKYK